MDERNIDNLISTAQLRDQMRAEIDKAAFENPIILLVGREDGTIASYTCGTASLSSILGMLEIGKIGQISAWNED